MSQSINPNDPVVAVLKGLVQQYDTKLDEKLDELAAGVQEAFRMMAEGNAATFQAILQRLVALESRLPVRQETEGKEL